MSILSNENDGLPDLPAIFPSMSNFSVKSDATKYGQHLSLPCLELGSCSTQDMSIYSQ